MNLHRFVYPTAATVILIVSFHWVSAQCCPNGPPYNPVCQESNYYFFHGNQLSQSASITQNVTQNPWRKIGSLMRTSTHNSANGTGILIANRWVLTAAHNVSDGPQTLSFALARRGGSCLPYGAVPVKRIFIPKEFIQNVGGSYNSQKTRAYDWALLELERRPTSTYNIPSAKTWSVVGTPYVSVYQGETVRAVGYSCHAGCSDTGTVDGRALKTDGSATFLNYKEYSSAINNGGLIVTDLEGTGGMSGGPVWYYEAATNKRRLLGVFIGSPQSACNNGKNWVAALSPGTQLRIVVVMNGTDVSSMQKMTLSTNAYLDLPAYCNGL
ncbi:MAG: serine protease [Bacteroidota bacterium]